MKRLLNLVFPILGLAYQISAQPQTLSLSAGPPSPIIIVSPTPTAPFGAGSFCYWVVANYPIGHSTPSNPGCTSPIVGASVVVNWNTVPGATSYDVLRTSSPILPTAGNISVSTLVSAPPLTDSFAALNSYTVATAPTANATFLLDNQNQANPQVTLSIVAGSYRNSFAIGSGGGGGGTVTTTGSPANGNLAKFSGSATITNADLSGDATTSGGTVVTLATVNAGPGTCGDATHVCQVVTNGKGLTTSQTAVAITAGTGNAAALVQIASTTGTVAFNCPSSTAGTVVEFAANASQNPIQLSGNITMTSTGCTAASQLVFIIQQAAAGGPFDITVPAGWDSAHIQQTASVVTKLVWDNSGHFLASSSTAGFSQGTEASAPGSNPPTNFEYFWFDSTRHTAADLNPSGQTHIMPRTAGSTDQLASADLSDSSTITHTIASGATAMPTTALAGNSCDASATTATATGAATSDRGAWAYASDPTGVTGYGGGTSGGITIRMWFTTNTVNFKRCNETGSSITPGAISINWGDVR